MTDDEILDGILRREGGYVNHPADKGGPTKYGITHRVLADWRKVPSVTANDVKALTEAEARDIYRARYIAPFSEADEEIREQLIDIAVNSGVSRAFLLMRRAMEHQRTRPLSTQLVIERLLFFARIVKANPSQAAFIEGWVNRAVSFL